MKDQSIFSLVIVLGILITFSLDSVWTLSGESWCWSLLELKALDGLHYTYVMLHYVMLCYAMLHYATTC